VSAQEQKERLRKKGRKAYPHDGELREQLSRRVCEIILQRREFLQARHVAIFAPLRWEVDLRLVWQKYPQKCAFPRISRQTDKMDFFLIETPDDLVSGFGGTLEPSSKYQESIQSWEANDLALIPGIAFDVYGDRVGSGKGYYDRFLFLHPNLKKWGVCWEKQVVNNKLAQQTHDVRMEAFCTESGWRKAQIE